MKERAPEWPQVNFTEKGRNGTIFEGHADVAQLVEQLIRNQQVVSSSLTVGSIANQIKSGVYSLLRRLNPGSHFPLVPVLVHV